MNGKRSVDDLAIFGGAPACSTPLHVGRPQPVSRNRLFARFDEILERNWLTNDGPLVREFEERIVELLGVRHCIAASSGTLALEISLRAAGVEGEVILPSFTFAATAHAVAWLGLKPVFCDIDRGTHALDPDRVERLITSRTGGIVGVHMWGQACAIDRLSEIASRHDIPLLFDAAHAFGNSYRGRALGNFGTVEVVSFHATKAINTFEGGAILTADDGIAERARRMRNFGSLDGDAPAVVGTNAKLCEAAAAMGLTMLEDLDQLFAANRMVHERYAARLADIPGVRLFPYDRSCISNYQYTVVEIDPAAAGISRDGVMRLLHAENILARRYFHPGCHRLEPYRSASSARDPHLPATDWLCDRVLCLPTGGRMSETDVDTVADLLTFAQAHGPAIARRLGET